MGLNQSKSNEVKIKEIDGNQNQYDILDLIATNYITTQNFKDLKNLIKPEYCNKLVILTTDVINNYLKQTKIKYLAKTEMSNDQKIKDEGIIYIQPKDKEETLHKNRGGNSKYSIYKGGYFDRRHDIYYDRDYDRDSNTGKKKEEKSKFSYLDVNQPDKKQRMCIGIAKFYVTIAHLWSAILLSINRLYITELTASTILPRISGFSIQNKS